MNILADENVDRMIVYWLREVGHRVVWIAEESSSVKDPAVAKRAGDEGMVLLTNDLDFGELVIRYAHDVPAIVLLRLPESSQEQRFELFVQRWRGIEEKLAGKFVVISEKKVRFRTL